MRGAESSHEENKNPNDGGCQTMELENVGKEKTKEKGLAMLEEPFVLDWRKNKKSKGDKKGIGCT